MTLNVKIYAKCRLYAFSAFLYQVTDINTMMTLMRYNDFENDVMAEVDGCDEDRVPAGAIAGRLDLSDDNATCTWGFGSDWMVGKLWG